MSDETGKVQKKSFVNPDSPEDTKEKKKPQIIDPAVTLMLIYNKQAEILAELKELNATFNKVKAERSEPPQPAPVSQPSQPSVSEPKPEPKQASNRIVEIRQKFEPFKDLVTLDEESDTLFVVIRPRQYLGAENFSKISSVVREIGGTYVSQGKASHFKVPKAEPRR